MLVQEHREDLHRSGLTDGTIALAELRSVDTGELRILLSPPLSERVRSAYEIPYPDTDGFYRLRLFPSIGGQKYYQPPKTAPMLYIPRRARAAKTNPAVDLYITEGEKKALKADQEGLACAGLGGLWSWLIDGKPLKDFDSFDWHERNVMLIPDSDVWTRPKLQQAVYALGKELEERGAVVSVLKLPSSEENGGKVGLDDYLRTHNTEELKKLKTLGLTARIFSRAGIWHKEWKKEELEQSSKAKRAKWRGEEVEFERTEPWPEHVDGARLLEDLATVFRRHLVLPAGGAEAMALWTLHSHALDATSISPILCFSSPEKRCGKSTALDVLEQVVPRPIPSVNISPAALYRSIQAWEPTLLIDEFDARARESDKNEELRGVLNAGHSRNKFVLRVVKDSGEPERFRVFCAKAIALIGKLPPTLEDRSIVISMRRRAQEERVARWRRDRSLKRMEELRRRAVRWTEDNLEALDGADPDMPKELNDRAQDNWRPLVSISELAGGNWPERAKEIAVSLSASSDEAESSHRTRLLADLRTLFSEGEADFLTSDEVVKALGEMEDRPWPEWSRGAPISKKALASLLRPFEVGPRQKREGARGGIRGYERRQLEPVWERYLPPDPGALTPSISAHSLMPPVLSATSATHLSAEHVEANSIRYNEEACSGSNHGLNDCKKNSVADVADRGGGFRKWAEFGASDWPAEGPGNPGPRAVVALLREKRDGLTRGALRDHISMRFDVPTSVALAAITVAEDVGAISADTQGLYRAAVAPERP